MDGIIVYTTRITANCLISRAARQEKSNLWGSDVIIQIPFTMKSLIVKINKSVDNNSAFCQIIFLSFLFSKSIGRTALVKSFLAQWADQFGDDISVWIIASAYGTIPDTHRCCAIKVSSMIQFIHNTYNWILQQS